MESESVRMLRERQAAVVEHIDALRPQLVALETELKQIRTALIAIEGIPITGEGASLSARAHFARKRHPEIEGMTIKEMVLKALNDDLSLGATASQLLDHLHLKWGRHELLRTSLSPQLSRLKEDGLIERDGKVWRLVHPDRDFPEDGNGQTSIDYDEILGGDNP